MDVGDRFGHYTLDALIGQGGMGVVYRATDTRTSRKVALKILHPAMAAEPTYRERFLRETAILLSAEHPNIVPIYSCGELDARLYFDMRLIHGEDLQVRVERLGRLRPADAVRTMSGVAEAVSFLHESGILHRDIKPRNVMVANGPRPFPYLLDFGIAQAEGESQLTQNGVIGSLDYMAPERFVGALADARSDIYALGGVLVFALSGYAPYFGRSGYHAMRQAHCEDPIPVPSMLSPDLAQFDSVVARAMAKNPADRFATAAEFDAALSDAMAEQAALDSTAARRSATATFPIGFEPTTTWSGVSPPESVLVLELDTSALTAATPPPTSVLVVEWGSTHAEVLPVLAGAISQPGPVACDRGARPVLGSWITGGAIYGPGPAIWPALEPFVAGGVERLVLVTDTFTDEFAAVSGRDGEPGWWAGLLDVASDAAQLRDAALPIVEVVSYASLLLDGRPELADRYRGAVLVDVGASAARVTTLLPEESAGWRMTARAVLPQAGGDRVDAAIASLILTRDLRSHPGRPPVPTKVLAPVLLAAREVKHQLCEHESAHVELNLGTHRVVSDVTRSSVAHVAVHDLLALVDVVRQHLEAQPDALVVLAGGGSRLPLLGPLFDSAGIASVHADADLLSAAHVRSR